MIKQKIENLQKQGINSNCYYLINSKDMQDVINKCGNDSEKLEYFYNLCASWDNLGSAIPLEIGSYIENLLKEPSVRIGIHRSSLVIDKNDDTLKSIMSSGLRNDAQISQGATHDIPDLTKTISFVNNMFHTIPMLKGSYKGSNGSILFAFPSEYVDQEGNVLPGFEDNIYEIKNGSYYIRPNFIIGYLVSEYGVYNLYTKEDILNIERK
ncbi:MAG: hypothetical protein IJN03_01680 [Bacilli bacterium]|nr:hypothetical protein [Bacilli bacterium]